jgi:TonB family protein
MKTSLLPLLAAASLLTSPAFAGGENPADCAESNLGSIKGVACASALERAPLALETPLPVYPLDLRRAGVQGYARVTMRVDENGRVVEARVIDSTSPKFSMAALAAASQWKFDPALAGGQPVSVWVGQTFTFVLPELARFQR